VKLMVGIATKTLDLTHIAKHIEHGCSKR